jgi:putative hydrolase of the HAD superfamily
LLIAFDLDDTLIDTSGAVAPFKRQKFLDFLIDRNVFGSRDRMMQKIESHDKSSLSSKEMIRSILQSYHALHLYDDAIGLYYDPLPKDFLIPTTPNAKKILEILKQRGHILALVTGGKRAFQLDKLEKAGLEPSIFSKINISEDSQKMPDYEALLKEFLVPPADCYAVGDRIQMDLAPAHALGWHTVHMRWGRGRSSKHEDWIDRSICELSDLLEFL